jgi:PIN domain nuclease of toxin-antitoxin system
MLYGDRRLKKSARERIDDELPVFHSTVAECVELPLHHRDPFDRMLIAQALQRRRIGIISKDPCFDAYTVLRAW